MPELARSQPLPERVRVPLLGVEVTPFSARETAELALAYARERHGVVIGNLNLHGVYVFHKDPDFRLFCDSSDLVLVDGIPIAWAGGIPGRFRTGSTDWLDALMPMAHGIHILAIGGTTDTAKATAQHMLSRFPEVHWVGVDDYRSHEVDDSLRKSIAEAQIVLVGMGMPLQERWLLRNRSLLEGKVVANVGGCFDYYAGTQQLAPRWMGRFGLEWIYRLARDPRRLSKRYLIEPFLLAGLLISRRLRRIFSSRD